MKFTPVTNLKPGMRIGQSLVGIPQTDKYVIGAVLTEGDILYLQEKGLFGVYTMEDDPAEILSHDLLYRCLYAVQKSDVETLISLSEQIVTELTSRPLSLDFRSIRSYESYLPHHSICVAVYAVAIGIRLQLSTARLNALALAGLLHDIGTTRLDQAVIRKTERLSKEEYDLIKQHSKAGYDFIKDNDRIPAMTKDAILHHHENANGTGYPDGQSEDQISTGAKILHVVDVYDAIMSKRPYKKGMSSAEALNYLIGGKTILFDPQVVDTFLEIAVPYPTGCEVRLSNEEIAQVVAQTADSQRPILLTSDHRMINLKNDAAYQDITILTDTAYEGSAEEAVSSEIELDTIATEGGRYRKKILIVDDVFVSIAYTKLALGTDYDIVTCLSGSKAAMMVKVEKPDLILMDYEMPDMDGVTAVNEIHKLGFHMPIIFLTGKSDKETVYACGKCGAVDYILKPANPVYLRTRVAMALHQIDGNAFL